MDLLFRHRHLSLAVAMLALPLAVPVVVAALRPERSEPHHVAFESASLTTETLRTHLEAQGYGNIGHAIRRGDVYLVRATGPDRVERILVVGVADGTLVGERVVPRPRPTATTLR